MVNDNDDDNGNNNDADNDDSDDDVHISREVFFADFLTWNAATHVTRFNWCPTAISAEGHFFTSGRTHDLNHKVTSSGLLNGLSEWFIILISSEHDSSVQDDKVILSKII